MEDDPIPSCSTSSQTLQTRPTEKTKTKSLVWTYFTKLSNEEAKCVKCKKIIKTPTGTTSGLTRHIKVHPLLNSEFIKTKTQQDLLAKVATQPKQSNIPDCFKQSTEWKHDDKKAKVITNKIACWMAKSFHPYSLVEEQGFRELMKEVVPLYQVPSRTTFSRTLIPKLYDETRQKVSNILTSDLEHVKSLSFTTDLWSSGSGGSFMSLTLHYMDKELKIKRYSLGAEYFSPEDHSGLSIRNKCMNMLEEWHLNSYGVPKYIVSDNATNMNAAFGTGDSPFIHLRCFAHTLQLCVNDVKQEVRSLSNLLAKSRSIVGRYKHSNKASQKLREFQTLMGLPNHSLYQDVDTRWNSEYLMLQRLLEQRNAVCAEIGGSGSSIQMLTNDEWSMAEEYVKVLQPFHHATKVVGEDVLPTKSLEIPILHGIEKFLMQVISSKDRGAVLARALLKSMKSRFPLYKSDHCRLLSMTMDPRFKHALLDGHEKERTIALLKNEIEKHSTIESGAPNPEIPTDQAEDILFGDIDNLQRDNINPSTSEQVEIQIKSYLEAKPIPRSEDISNYWRAQRINLNLLVPVAEEFLPIPSSSIASERMFSSAGNVVTKRRQSLLSKHVSELVFLHENL